MNQTISHPPCHPTLLSPADDYVEDHLDLNLLQHLTCCEECRQSKVGQKEVVELTGVNVRFSAYPAIALNEFIAANRTLVNSHFRPEPLYFYEL
jgi:hypothetical protein